MHELHPAIATERVDHRIQSVSDDAVATFDAGIGQHLPDGVSNCGHGNASRWVD
jgi:hypothetical protein